MPDEDAYLLGKMAFREGKAIFDNPYHPARQPDKYQFWMNGYFMASVDGPEQQ